jgi:hypothetical protein
MPRGYTLKTELIHHQTFRNREEAKQVVFEYIEVFYNRERLHSANGYLSTVDYEAQQYAAWPCVWITIDKSIFKGGDMLYTFIRYCYTPKQMDLLRKAL